MTEPSQLSETFVKRVEDGSAVVGVFGLGYVGLPLALAFVGAEFRVVGFDTDAAKCAALTAGESYIEHIAAARIGEANGTGRFRATADMAAAGECDALILCVPTPLTRHREPDMSFIEGTARAIAPHLKRGALVSLESTTYPGTTEEVLIPILEGSGLRAGPDFLVAYSPEREDPANRDFTTARIPKVVGALDADSLRAACALYGKVVSRVVPVSSLRVAEATKLLENVFRCVNIAMVNELKVVFQRMGIDIWEVIDAAKTKPFGYMPFYPGPGLGGHCIPIDPFYLTWKAREFETPTRFIELAGEINAEMPRYVVSRAMEALNEHGKALRGSRILILGLAYKKDVDDQRESPALKLLELFEERGASVDYHDPHIPAIKPTRQYPQFTGRASVGLAAVGEYDAVVVCTDHSAVDYAAVANAARLVVDTRNVVKVEGVWRA